MLDNQFMYRQHKAVEYDVNAVHGCGEGES